MFQSCVLAVMIIMCMPLILQSGQSGTVASIHSATELQGGDFKVYQGWQVCRNASMYSAPEAQSKSFDGIIISRANVSYRALIKFSIDDIADVNIVKDCAIMLFLETEYENSHLTLEAHMITTDWRENEASWLNRNNSEKWAKPGGDFALDAVAKYELPASFGKGWVVLKSRDLTKQIKNWICDKESNYGLMLISTSTLGGPSMKIFADSKDKLADRGPKLILSFGKEIDPQKFGYISEEALVRRPLTTRLEKVVDQIGKRSHDESAGRIDEIKSKIRTLSANDKEQSKQINAIIDQLQINLMQQCWPGMEIIAWSMGPWENLPRDTFPTKTPVELQTRMLLNEYEELSFAVTNISGKEQNLEVKLDGRNQFPPDTITLRHSYWIKAKTTNELRGDNTEIWLDDALLRLDHDRYLTLSPGETKRIWTTISSHNVKPGDYVFEFVLNSQAKAVVKKIPLKVKVLPIKLEPDPKLHVFSYAYLNRLSTANYKRIAVEDLKAHYDNTFVIDAYPEPNISSGGLISGQVDYDAKLGEWLDLVHDAKKVLFYWCWDCGMSRETFGGKTQWLSAAWKKALQQYVAGWSQYLQSKGFDYDRFVLYPFDETYDNQILGRTEYQAFAECAKAIHENDKKIQLFLDPLCFRDSDRMAFEQIKDDVAVWSAVVRVLEPGEHSGFPYAFSATEKRAAMQFFHKEKQAGKFLWAYQCDGPMKALDINGYYHRFAWLCWANGVTGLGLWSYNDIRPGTSVGSSWNDFDEVDFSMIYELRNAPLDISRNPNEPLIPSRRWQIWRQGIEDYLLLQQVKRYRPELTDRLNQIVNKVLVDASNGDVYKKSREDLIDMLSK